MNLENLVELGKEFESELIEIRRELHKIPEIGFELPKTISFVCKKLDEYNISYELMGSGVVATVIGGNTGKTIAFRADMDALNIIEQTDVPFKSEHIGRMHACGHDAHTAMLLITAKLLNRFKNDLTGNVKFIFQPSEENGEGANVMISAGVLDGVDAVCALHVGNIAGDNYPSGSFVVLPGAVSSGKNKFTIEVIGKSTHGAFPHKGIDPISVSAHIITALQEIHSRELPTGTPAIITFGSISAGIDNNSIPDKAILKGSTRTQSEEVREFVSKRIEDIAKGVAKSFRAECNVEMIKGSNAVINDEKLSRISADALISVFDEATVFTDEQEKLMGSDDFSNYSSKIPGLYYFLNTNNPEMGINVSNHNSCFNIDESVLWKGAVSNAVIAVNYLNK